MQVQALSNLGHDYEVRISAMVMHVVLVKYMVLLMEVHQKILNELIVQASVYIFPSVGSSNYFDLQCCKSIVLPVLFEL